MSIGHGEICKGEKQKETHLFADGKVFFFNLLKVVVSVFVACAVILSLGRLLRLSSPL